LQWLKQGKVHVAGTHLRDSATGDYNLPIVKHLFPQGTVKVITFAIWEQGLVTRTGKLRSAMSRTWPEKTSVLSIAKKAPAAGSFSTNTSAPPASQPDRVKGYDRIATGHLPAAQAVSHGEADCCIATRSAARAFGLHFIPLATERYDLVVRRQYVQLPAIQALFDALNRSALRRKLELLAGYDTSHTGEVLVA
jgi:putative molybdopterin biosynthesis protein